MFTLVTAGVASLATWRAARLLDHRRLCRLETQVKAALMLSLEIALQLGASAEALSAARRALGGPEAAP